GVASKTPIHFRAHKIECAHPDVSFALRIRSRPRAGVDGKHRTEERDIKGLPEPPDIHLRKRDEMIKATYLDEPHGATEGILGELHVGICEEDPLSRRLLAPDVERMVLAKPSLGQALHVDDCEPGALCGK